MLFPDIPNKTRRESVELLSWYLQNPGRFSILILGKTGVGKGHWVRVIQQQIQGKIDCTKAVITVNLGSAEATLDYWENIFKMAHGNILLIKELERVKPHEQLLFQALATANGKYGFQSKTYETRVVFTTSLPIEALRKTEKWISHRLFDRISQLVVRFPAYEEADKGLWEDFKATWEKMRFADHNKLPGQKLKYWLERNSQRLNGNFRDLDKIAILWHQFRLIGKKEQEILQELKDQFESYTSFPEQHAGMGGVFYFQKGLSKKEILKEFRAALKRWAILTYGSQSKAETAMGMGHKTMGRW